jgi:hypothetical protein
MPQRCSPLFRSQQWKGRYYSPVCEVVEPTQRSCFTSGVSCVHVVSVTVRGAASLEVTIASEVIEDWREEYIMTCMVKPYDGVQRNEKDCKFVSRRKEENMPLNMLGVN